MFAHRIFSRAFTVRKWILIISRLTDQTTKGSFKLKLESVYSIAYWSTDLVYQQAIGIFQSQVTRFQVSIPPPPNVPSELNFFAHISDDSRRNLGPLLVNDMQTPTSLLSLKKSRLFFRSRSYAMFWNEWKINFPIFSFWDMVFQNF